MPSIAGSAMSHCSLPQGRVELPRQEDMAAEVDRCTAWRRSFMPHQPSLGGKLNHLCQGYHDELVTDMGESKWRKVHPSGAFVGPCSASEQRNGWDSARLHMPVLSCRWQRDQRLFMVPLAMLPRIQGCCRTCSASGVEGNRPSV